MKAFKCKLTFFLAKLPSPWPRLFILRRIESTSERFRRPHTAVCSYGAAVGYRKTLKWEIYAQCALAMPLPYAEWSTTEGRGPWENGPGYQVQLTVLNCP